MSELAERCGQINRASIYRTVRLFEDLDIVHRIQVGWKYKLELSDNFQHHHHHLHCTGCGAVTAIPEDNQLENRLLEIAGEKGFEAHDHQVEIRGLCPSCQHK